MSIAAFGAPEIERFRRALAQHMGLRFDDDKTPLLGEVLATRLRATGSRDADAYLAQISADAAELGDLAKLLSVGETYFFRNRDQFRALEAMLRDRAAAGRRHLRVLSAGCASGEEPYSIAMLARETLGAAGGSGISIVAFDINPEALRRAGEGRYADWSLRETVPDMQRKYFRSEGKQHVVIDEVRAMVRFEQRNLGRPDPGFWCARAFDVIFCRNVLMYFTPEAARRVVDRLSASLAAGGHLFLGHAENLRGISNDFHLVHSHETFYYRRRTTLEATRIGPSPETALAQAEESPAPGRQPSMPPLADDVSWFEAIARASARIEDLARRSSNGALPPSPPVVAPDPAVRAQEGSGGFAAALELLKQERYADALQMVPAGSGEETVDPDALLLRAVLMVGVGDARGAESACREVLRIDELNAGAHYVVALCRDQAGDRAAAIEHDRIASYLDPDFAMPHLHVGLVSRRRRDIPGARRELALARGLLAREDAARIVLFGGGFGRQALIALCDAELAACGAMS
jgi:chemotaxis protein methyltransferase CheR